MPGEGVVNRAQASTFERYRERFGAAHAIEDREGFLRIVAGGCLYRIDRDGGFYDGCRLSAEDLRALAATAGRI